MRLCAILWLLAINVTAQDLSIKQYRVENGLPTDIVRTIAQDTLGYFWFGTNDGLIKFDGNTFTAYPNATPSTNIKSIYTCDDGKIFALSDLGLTQIVNLVDTLYFDTKIDGSNSQQENKLWNPKSVYEDKSERFWFGEPQSIMQYYKGKMTRHFFSTEYNSTSLDRSFTFTQDSLDRVFAASYTGHLLLFNENSKAFDEILLPVKFSEINHIYAFGDFIFLATYKGAFRFKVVNNKVVEFSQIGDMTNLSFITLRTKNSLILTSFNSEFYYINNPESKKPVIERFEEGLPGINNVFISNENDIWLSTEKGGVVLLEKPFRRAHEDEYKFVNAVTGDNKNKIIYVGSRNQLESYTFRNNTLENKKVLMEGRKTDFLSLAINKNGLWASNTSKIHLFKDQKLHKTFNFEHDGGFIFDLLSDNEENIWFTQDGSTAIKKITPDHTVKYYHTGVATGIQAITSGNSTIYAGGSTAASYLFEYLPVNDTFKNLSVPFTFKPMGSFQINDLLVMNDSIWMASSDGLLVYSSGSVSRIDLGENFTELNVRSLEKENDSTIWFSNPYGLVKYNLYKQDYTLFDESSGLPSNYIGPRGIYICAKSRIWTGTASGLAYSNFGEYTERDTPNPQIISVSVNGKDTKFFASEKVEYQSDALVNIHFSSISFPNNKIQYSYRLDGAKWSKPIAVNDLEIPKLEPGTHQFEIRAKNTGRLNWSKATLLNLQAESNFLQTLEAKLLLILAIAAIIFSTYKSTIYFLRRRHAFLEKLILERTRDLESANKSLATNNKELTRAEELLRTQFNELERTNKELDQFVYSASHDLSAPLKSLSGLVYIAKHETKDKSQSNLLEMMQQSISKLENFIKDVINYSRNSRVDIDLTEIHVFEVANEISKDLEHLSEYEGIKFQNKVPKSARIFSDQTRFKIILNNLISNAIKFQRLENSNKPIIKVSFERSSDHYILRVEDNGIGIDEVYLTKIFDMFYRANQDSNGSGLGLYILKETVDKLGGSVKVESKFNEGTAFTIMIPIPQSDAVVTEPSPIDSVAV